MSNNTELVQQGIAAVKAGDLAAARLLFANVLQTEPENEVAWLWLSGAVASNAERKRRAGAVEERVEGLLKRHDVAEWLRASR